MVSKLVYSLHVLTVRSTIVAHNSNGTLGFARVAPNGGMPLAAKCALGRTVSATATNSTDSTNNAPNTRVGKNATAVSGPVPVGAIHLDVTAQVASLNSKQRA